MAGLLTSNLLVADLGDLSGFFSGVVAREDRLNIMGDLMVNVSNSVNSLVNDMLDMSDSMLDFDSLD